MNPQKIPIRAVPGGAACLFLAIISLTLNSFQGEQLVLHTGAQTNQSLAEDAVMRA
jgi:hypothetical protein